ncbi:MAG TPA: glycosyltransferase, partial [Pyrinomonadaceae bacterium]|nr:glycosyltransferase [Pyrinomonadaceae bacterium]
MRVLMMPDYRADNPYQSLLAAALEACGARVSFPAGYRRALPLFRAAAGGAKYDVLHLHWIAPYLKGERAAARLGYALKLLLDVALVRLAGVRVVWTIHNRREHNSKFPRVEAWARRGLAKLAGRVVVHNASVLEGLSSDLGISPNKAEVIPHGHFRVYGSLTDPLEARRRLGLPPEGRVFLNFGMLRPYKGVERLLKLWREHAAEFAGDTLVVAGKPVDESYGETLSRLAVGVPGVHLNPRFVRDEDVPLYFSAADVVVLPFENILTSGSLILAMSYERPVVAPDLGGVRETLAESCRLLYDPADERGLEDVLRLARALGPQHLRANVSTDRLDWQHI